MTTETRKPARSAMTCGRRLVRRTGGGSFLLMMIVTIAGIAAFLYSGRDSFNRAYTARVHVGACGIDGDIYVFGGQTMDRGMLPDVLAFDLQRGRVSRFGDMPWPATDAIVVQCGGRLYVLGGYSGRTYSSDILVLDPQSGTIALAGELPAPLLFGAATEAAGTIYYVGGWDREAVRCEVLALAQNLSSADVIAELPVAVRYCAATSIGRRLYVLGGEDGGGELQATLTEIDLSTGEQRTFATPEPISHAALVGSGGCLYVFGGWNNGPIDTIACISLEGDSIRYEQIGRLAAPSSDCVALAMDGRLLVVGGEPTHEGKELRVQEFDPSSGTFTLHRFRGSI